MASILLEKPRPEDFEMQLGQIYNFVSTNCKSKLGQLPKYVQILDAAETRVVTGTAVTDKTEKQQYAGARSSAASSSAATAAESLSPVSDKVSKPLRKKAKLS